LEAGHSAQACFIAQQVAEKADHSIITTQKLRKSFNNSEIEKVREDLLI
jgi:hypothetical protein